MVCANLGIKIVDCCQSCIIYFCPFLPKSTVQCNYVQWELDLYSHDAWPRSHQTSKKIRDRVFHIAKPNLKTEGVVAYSSFTAESLCILLLRIRHSLLKVCAHSSTCGISWLLLSRFQKSCCMQSHDRSTWFLWIQSGRSSRIHFRSAKVDESPKRLYSQSPLGAPTENKLG